MKRMLRLVASDGKRVGPGPPIENSILRAALERITMGKPHSGIGAIFCQDEADVLYELLHEHDFTQLQLDTWLNKLAEDHPLYRRNGSVEAWKSRAKAFIDNTIASADDPTWITHQLRALARVTFEARDRTGRARWSNIPMRWALVHLITTQAELPPTAATG